MYNRLKALYAAGRLTAAQLAEAVRKGWISEEERGKIVGGEG